jgi:hypothetical protein
MRRRLRKRFESCAVGRGLSRCAGGGRWRGRRAGGRTERTRRRAAAVIRPRLRVGPRITAFGAPTLRTLTPRSLCRAGSPKVFRDGAERRCCSANR